VSTAGSKRETVNSFVIPMLTYIIGSLLIKRRIRHRGAVTERLPLPNSVGEPFIQICGFLPVSQIGKLRNRLYSEVFGITIS
jgi:hypothetical protein